METAQERAYRIQRLEQSRAQRRAEMPGGTIWPTPDDAGTGVIPLEIGPGRGDLRYSAGFVPTFPTALGLINRTVSFARLFQSQPWVAAAVMRMLAWAIRVPLRTYKRQSGENNNKRLKNGEHPISTMIANPYPGGNAAQLIMHLLGPVLVHGNSVSEIDDSHVLDNAMGIIPKDWRFSQPLMPWRAELAGFKFDTDTPVKSHEVSINKVLHIAWWSPIGPLGTSPLMQLGTSLQIEDAAQRYQVATMRHGGRPPSAITMDEAFLGVNRDERLAIIKQIRQDVADIYGGPENAGRPALLPPGLDWKPVGQTTVEAALIEQRKITREEIAAVYLIPPPLLGIMDRATYANIGIQREMCLPGDALVATDHGPVPASEVRAGDRVFAVKDGKLQRSVVSWQGCTGIEPLVTVKTLNRTVRCTANHPIYVARRHPGAGRRPVRWTHEWVPAGEVNRGDVIVQAERLPDYGGRSCPTRETVSEGFMEFCGLWLGDGSLARDSAGRPRRVVITRSENARYMDHYRDVMRAEFIKLRNGGHRHRVALAEVVPATLREDRRDTILCSSSAAGEIEALGFGSSAHSKVVPEWVFELEPTLRAAFLRGFIDADGTVDRKGHIIVGLCNERLVRQLRELCISVGVPVSNVRTKRQWVTLPQGNRYLSTTWTFSAGDPAANAAIIGSHDPVDQERMESGRPWRRSYDCPLSVEGCALGKVLSVEHGDIGVPVYNITVPDGQNFVVDGVVTHNTYTDVLGPPLILIEQAINAQIIRDLLQDDQVFVEFDFGAVLRGDRLQEIDAIRDAIASALMTPNEGRSVLNMPAAKVEGMDTFYIPGNNLKPVEQAGQINATPPQLVPFTGQDNGNGAPPQDENKDQQQNPSPWEGQPEEAPGQNDKRGKSIYVPASAYERIFG